MNIITESDYLNIMPNSNQDYFQKLGSNRETYLKLSSLYRSLLNQYLKIKVLGKYDNILVNSNLNFLPLPIVEQDIYQFYNNADMKYYYVRNNIYIEYLNTTELKYLTNKFLSKNTSLTEEDAKFIETTFAKVIQERLLQSAENYNVFYGPNSLNYSGSHKSLVIGVRYDEFNQNDMTDEKWEENYDKQQDLLINLNTQLEKELQNMFGMPVKVIEYFDGGIVRVDMSQINEGGKRK